MFFLIRSLFKLGVFAILLLIAVGGVYWFLLPDAAALPDFPNLPGYQVASGEDVSQYLIDLETSDSLEITAHLASIGRFTQCYQDIGGVRIQAYRNDETFFKAGIVTMASENALLNPGNFAQCVAQADQNSGGVQIQSAVSFCQASYELPKAEDTIHIGYFGTTQEVCQAFCTQLEGCTAHR